MGMREGGLTLVTPRYTRSQLAKLPNTAEVVVEVIEDSRGFAALEEEWDDLHRQCPQATPFQSWAWLYSWWEYYGEGYKLRLITVRYRGLLVGIIPLMLKRQWGHGRLLFVGTGPTDHLDVIVRKGWEDLVAEAGIKALRQMDDWHVADLQELRPEAAARALFEYWPDRKASVWQSQCPVIEATNSWDQLLMYRSKRLRNNARRALRRVEADAVRCELAGADEAREAVARLVTLSREQWRGNPLTGPEHWTPRFKSHLQTAAFRMTARRLGAICEWQQDGQVILSEFLVFGPGYCGGYMVAASRKALRRYQISALTANMETNIARQWEASYVGQGRDQQDYKLRWSSAMIDNYRLIVGCDSVFWSLYTSYHALRSAAKRYVLRPNSPDWVRSIARRYRARRHAVSRFMRRMKRNKCG
jgi:hypothetical protein